MNILTTIIVVLVILWAIGFATSAGGGLIHLLLVIAGIVLVYRLIKGEDLMSGK